MQLPVNITDFLKAFDSVKKAQEEPISVSVYLDDTASAELVAHVRSVFASASAHARITLSYLEFAHHSIEQHDDMVVLVAGQSDEIGTAAATLREAGIAVMVVADDGEAVAVRAAEAGAPIPENDLIFPIKAAADEPASEPEPEPEPDQKERGSRFSRLFDGQSRASSAAPAAKTLDEEDIAALDLQMGKWISNACSEKRLAFALAFPFVRRPLSLDSVNVTAIENALVGGLVIIPGADMPIMTLNQIKMLLRIASAYGQPLTIQRAKELAATVFGGFFCRSVSRNLCGIVPIAGPVIKAGVGYAGTIAMGRAAIEYFEGGGGVVGLGKAVNRARDAAVKAVLKARRGDEEPEPEPATFSEKASKTAQVWGGRASKLAGVASSVAGPLLSSAASVGADTLREGAKSLFRLKR